MVGLSPGSKNFENHWLMLTMTNCYISVDVGEGVVIRVMLLIATFMKLLIDYLCVMNRACFAVTDKGNSRHNTLVMAELIGPHMYKYLVESSSLYIAVCLSMSVSFSVCLSLSDCLSLCRYINIIACI